MPGSDRKAERIPLDGPARLHPNEWSSLEVRLLDCSEGGFRADCEARVQVGAQVTIELPGVGPARAYVAWRRGSQFGAQFLEPVAIERVRMPRIATETVLARLLVERAAAHRSGLHDEEAELRRRIQGSLPLRRP